MKILVNGAWRELQAATLAAALAELGYGEPRRGHGGERRFVAAAARARTRARAMGTASKSWRRCRGADAASYTAPTLRSRLLLGTARYPSPAVLQRRGARLAARGRDGFAATRVAPASAPGRGSGR